MRVMTGVRTNLPPSLPAEWHAQPVHASHQEMVWQTKLNSLGLFPKSANEIARSVIITYYFSRVFLSGLAAKCFNSISHYVFNLTLHVCVEIFT